jgi:uncharacterized membrane protein YgdD (TMEM256/DUF423 family)
MRWTCAALALQLIGYVFDVLWHAVLQPGAEPATLAEMVRHLATVHLALYIGAAMALVSTVVELLRRRRRRPVGNALPIAVTGAVVSCGAEGWHALSHLRLDTHAAPVAGILSVIGFLVVVGAMVVDVRAAARRNADTARARRAA